jgi:predicted transcriptional regulator YdeE
MYPVKIIKKEEMKVTAFVLQTTFADNRQAEEIPPFFHRIMAEETLEEVPDRINKNQICVVARKENSPAFEYCMGVETSGFDHTSAGMRTLTLPACTYAAAPFVKRGNADVLKAFKFITEIWMPDNGYRPNVSAPAFIYYDERFIPIYKELGYDGNPVAEIFVPVT